MTIWHIILAILFPIPLTRELTVKERQIAELQQKIESHEYQMKIAEMADDRYYTNGRRRRDLDDLRDMKNDLKFILSQA